MFNKFCKTNEYMRSKHAIVFGASGLIGSYLPALLSQKSYERIQVWTRASIPETSSIVEQVIWDTSLNNESQLSKQLETSMLKGDVFIALGTTIHAAGSKEKFEWVDFHLPRIIIKAAEQKECPAIALVSSLGASSESKNFYLRTKGRVEQLIQECKIPKALVLRPSLLLGPRKEFRLGERIAQILMTSLSFLMIGPLRKYRPIQAEKVASLLVEGLDSLPNDVKEIREIE